MTLLNLFFLILLSAVCLYTDLKKRWIPNIVTIPVFLVGLCVSSYRMYQTEGINGVILVLANLIVAFAICEFLLVRKGFWAYGDVKLFMASVVWFPPFVGLLASMGLYIAFHFGYIVTYRLLKRWNIILPSQFPGSVLIVLVVMVNIWSFWGNI